MERSEPLAVATAPPGLSSAGAYVDWAAVLAGAVVAAAVASVFAAFGAALGLSTISAAPQDGGSFSFWLIVTAIWAVVSLAVSYLAGGYVAGRMRRRIDPATADEIAARDSINGLVVWGIGILVTTWMTLGMIGTATHTAGTVVAAAAETATSAAAGGMAQAVGAAVPDDAGAIGWISDSLMRTPLAAAPTGTTADAVGLADDGAAILANLMRTGEIADDDRAFLVAATARVTGLTPAEAEARVAQALTAAEDARAEAARQRDEAETAAREAAEAARVGTILTGFLFAAASLVAAATAVAGAVRGGRHRDEGRLFAGLGYPLRS